MVADISVSLDETLLAELEVKSRQSGQSISALVEAALVRQLGLDRHAGELDDDEAMALALEAQRAARPQADGPAA